MEKETIYEAFINKLCTNCANRDKDLCNIIRRIDNTLDCEFCTCKEYEKDKPVKGYVDINKRRYV